jgi:hypothetical protein
MTSAERLQQAYQDKSGLLLQFRLGLGQNTPPLLTAETNIHFSTTKSHD